MESITKLEVHPKFPDFKATIRYISRPAILKQQAKIERRKRPYIVKDADTGKPVIIDGEPLVVWKADISDDFATDNVLEYVVGFEGHPDGVAFSPATIDALFDPRFDVPIVRDVQEKNDKGESVTVKKSINASWATALQIKAYDRATFDADPSVPASAK